MKGFIDEKTKAIFDDDYLQNELPEEATKAVAPQIDEAEAAFRATLTPEQQKMFVHLTDLYCMETGLAQAAIVARCRQTVDELLAFAPAC